MRGYECDLCGAELFHYPLKRICDSCEKELSFTGGRFCEKCGRQTKAEGICLACKSRLPAFTRGFSPFVYEGSVALALNRFKNGKRYTAWYFGEQMAETLVKRVPDLQEVLVIPVPLTAAKRSIRGYNQAEEFSVAIVKHLADVGVTATLDTTVLIKNRETAQQKSLAGKQRADNLSGAYHVHKRSVCKDRVVLLVDDIMTTGVTGSECAAKLKGAGAKEVIFLTVAATPEN